MKKSIILLLTISSFAFATDAAKLINDNCVSCHLLTKPTQQQKSKMKAPPMSGVMFHLKDALKDEQKIIDFIVDYVQNPTKEKAICLPQKIQRFGLMPSMKGVLSEDELKLVAKYLYDNFPPAGFQHKQGMNKAASKKGKKKNSPFLIIGKMPHLTKMVKMNWDRLNLSEKQQEELLKIRQETMSNVMRLKPQIQRLEKEVAKSTMLGDTPQSLKAKVDQIAKLKAEATMVHINCIYQTKKVLTPEQLKMILPKKANKRGK